MFTKKVKIQKHLKNTYVSHSLFGSKIQFEILKWFWLLTFSQPFKKMHQRFAFLLLDLVFFIRYSLFAILIKKVRPLVATAKRSVSGGFRFKKQKNSIFLGVLF